jgi:hypothetical protein
VLIWTLKDIIGVTALVLFFLLVGTLAALERIHAWRMRRRAKRDRD